MMRKKEKRRRRRRKRRLRMGMMSIKGDAAFSPVSYVLLSVAPSVWPTICHSSEVL